MKTRAWFHEVSLRSVFLFLIASALSVEGQVVVTPPIKKVPPAARISSRSHAVAPLSDISSAIIAGAPFYQRGRLSVRPRVSYSWMKSDGILARPGESADTSIQTISPGLLAELGDHWRLDYSPSWEYYSNPIFEDTVDHSASLTGNVSRGDLGLGFAQHYTSETHFEISTGQQTHQETHSTTFNVDYRLSDRTRVDATLGRNVRFANTFTETTPDLLQWRVASWIHYEFSERLDTAAGISYTIDNLSSGSDMTQIQPQVRVSWRATDKISFFFEGGIETIDYHTGGLSNDTTPIYSGFVAYRPFDTTTISIEASTNLRPSYFSDQNVESTGWSASLEQRLLGRLFLSISARREETEYVATSSEVAAGRTDTYYTYNFRLSTAFLSRGTVSVFYGTGKNTSNVSEFELSNRQFGCELAYRF